MGLGFSQGCHRCGGHPGHKSKDRAYLIECNECGTFTCNQHISILGGCPKCKSNKVRKVMTQRDVKKHEKGGMADTSGSSDGSSKSQSKDSQGGFSRGGNELPKAKNHGGTTLGSSRQEILPENMKNTSDRLEGALGNKNDAASADDMVKSVKPGPTAEHTHHHSHKHTHDHKDLASSKYETLDDLFDDAPASATKRKPASKENPVSDEDEIEDETEDETEDENAPEEDLEDADTDDESQEDDAPTDEEEVIKSADSLSEEEIDVIEQEFNEISAKRGKQLESLPDLEFMRALAKTERKKITMSNNIADAFWGLSYTGLKALSEGKEYEKSALHLKENTKKDRENPHLVMSVLAFEPSGRLDDSIRAADDLQTLEGCFLAIGHGPRCRLPDEESVLNLKSLYARLQGFIAVGLVGLDKLYAPYTIDAQKSLLCAQLDMAVDAGLPVYLTCRGAEEDLGACLSSKPGYKNLRFVYVDLIESDEMLEIIEAYDMHVCMRPELTHETNKDKLKRAGKINPARLLLASGFGYSAPKGHETKFNKPEFLPVVVSVLSRHMQKHEDEFKTLCMGNMARLFFGEPWASDSEVKEDLWADFT